eukprot:c26185_g1_i1 orf=140-769(-)
MGHHVRHNKLHHRHDKHRPAHAARNNAAYYPPASADPPVAVPYPAALPSSSYDTLYNSVAPYPNISTLSYPYVGQQEQLNQAIADVRRHGMNERIGEIGAAAAGAFALYELHEAKVDPAHARRHKTEAQVAGAIALGSASYAYHEHKEKKKSEHLVEALSGVSHHNKDSKHRQGYAHNEYKEKKSDHLVEVLNGISHHSKLFNHKLAHF